MTRHITSSRFSGYGFSDDSIPWDPAAYYHRLIAPNNILISSVNSNAVTPCSTFTLPPLSPSSDFPTVSKLLKSYEAAPRGDHNDKVSSTRSSSLDVPVVTAKPKGKGA